MTEIEDAPGSARAIVEVPQTALIHLFSKRARTKLLRECSRLLLERLEMYRSKNLGQYDSYKKEAENVVSWCRCWRIESVQ